MIRLSTKRKIKILNGMLDLRDAYVYPQVGMCTRFSDVDYELYMAIPADYEMEVLGIYKADNPEYEEDRRLWPYWYGPGNQEVRDAHIWYALMKCVLPKRLFK